MMAEDYPLFSGVPPHVRGSDTSAEAALAALEGSQSVRAAVLRAIRCLGLAGATDDELEASLGLRHQTLSARRRELVLLGAVRDSGLRRRTSSGRRATVWVAS